MRMRKVKLALQNLSAHRPVLRQLDTSKNLLARSSGS